MGREEQFGAVDGHLVMYRKDEVQTTDEQPVL